MRFHPFEISIPHIVYAALGGFIVLFGMFSLFIREKLYIGEAIWAFLFGVVIGPYGANIFDPRGWGGGDNEVTNTITLEVTRVVLAIGVFAIGVELPKAYMQKHWKSLLFLLGPVMTWGWFVSGGLIYALIPGLNFLSSLVVAACLTPTDPILAAAVVGGKYADKHVPAHLRHLLAAESGCNDGAAFPFLFIALYLITDSSTGQAISDWFLLLWLYQVVVGIVFGAILGFGFRHLMKFCERKDLIDRQSYVAQYVSLAMLTIGATTLLGSDDLLAAFSCGAAFAWDGFFNKQTEESVFSSVIDLLFNIAAFVFVGAWMPFSDFSNENLTLSVWRLLVIAILVMLLRRLPIIIALYRWIPDIKTFREAIFSGHFGPMGIGAVFICTLAAEQLPRPEEEPENQQQLLAASIQPIVAFMVLVSIAIHGLSIPFFTFGRRVHSMSRTWSRHDTVGTFGSRRRSILPEWTTQIRHVQPGEEIVINRDGERDGHAESLTPVDGASSQDEKHEDDVRENGERRGGNPPDGTEVLQEWKEGPHRVIERRDGPGEEVEVEVQRNAYGPSETTTHTLHVAAEMSRHVVDDIRHKMQHAPDELEHTLAQAQEGVRREAHEVEQKTKDAGLAALAATATPSSPSASTSAAARAKRDGNGQQQGQAQAQGDDEDEGWMSDRSAGEPSGSGSTTAAGSARGKSPKLKIPKPKISVSGARKRSIRRNVLGQRPQSIHRSQSEDLTSRRPPLAVSVSLDEDEEYPTYEGGDPDAYEPASAAGSGAATPSEETRGRGSAMRSPRSFPSGAGNGAGNGDGTHSGTHTPAYAHAHARPTHKRIGSIRSGAPSREMSPARSVRFVDDGPGPGKPPRLLSPTSQTFPHSQSQPGGTPLQQSSEETETGTGTDGQQEDDSPRSQAVRFSLPAPGDTANHVHGKS